MLSPNSEKYKNEIKNIEEISLGSFNKRNCYNKGSKTRY